MSKKYAIFAVDMPSSGAEAMYFFGTSQVTGDSTNELGHSIRRYINSSSHYWSGATASPNLVYTNRVGEAET